MQPVTNITGIPIVGTVGEDLALSGMVSPANATNQAIVWTVKTGGGTGASITENSLSITTAGTVEVTATIANGIAVGTDYTQDFSITINPPPGSQLTRTIKSINVPFRYVPAGSFQRDSTAANITIITTGYWMGETEVTQELFQAVMGINPSGFDGNTGNEPETGETQNKRPVERVSWYDAIAFCNKLSIADGKEPVYSVSGIDDWASLAYSAIPTSNTTAWNAVLMDITKNGYRFPTGMEWMWAAMGADTTSQPNTTGYAKAFAGNNGTNSIDDYAWYGNSSGKTHEVGKRAANELGLYDMTGNVNEWCWGNGTIGTGSMTNPIEPASGSARVLRGGCYLSAVSLCTVDWWGNLSPYNRAGKTIGFRVVCGQ
jgi:formylglycine-generating enzyme required for sulfatase activity